MDTLPIFTTDASLGKSILTVDDIAKIVKLDNIKKFIVLENGVTSFPECVDKLKRLEGTVFLYGIWFYVCNDLNDENLSDSRCKMVALIKGDEAYTTFCKFSTEVNTHPSQCIDYKGLAKYANTGIQFAVPFYDSFIHRNALWGANCMPDFSVIKPQFWMSDNKLPFDGIIRGRLQTFVKDLFECREVKHIYYESRQEFLDYMVYRLICNNKANQKCDINKPELNHFGSDKFSLEEFRKEKVYYTIDKKRHEPVILSEREGQRYIVFDTETTSLNLVGTYAWQIAWVEMIDDKVVKREMHYLKWDDLKLSDDAARVTGFDLKVYLELAENPRDIMEKFLEKIYDPEVVIVGQNILGFDVYVLNNTCTKCGMELNYSFIPRCVDTVAMSRSLVEEKPKLRMESLIEWCYRWVNTRIRGRGKSVSQGVMLKKLGIPVNESKLHDALYDTEKCGELFNVLMTKVRI